MNSINSIHIADSIQKATENLLDIPIPNLEIRDLNLADMTFKDTDSKEEN
jgi:hypothetical protein